MVRPVLSLDIGSGSGTVALMADDEAQTITYGTTVEFWQDRERGLRLRGEVANINPNTRSGDPLVKILVDGQTWIRYMSRVEAVW